jgi:hypothetical protein
MTCQEFVFWIGEEGREERKKERTVSLRKLKYPEKTPLQTKLRVDYFCLSLYSSTECPQGPYQFKNFIEDLTE